MTAQFTQLAASRFHLHHGPIDCIAEITGSAMEIAAISESLRLVFPVVLPTLVNELALLRSSLFGLETRPVLYGPVAQRMLAACWPLRSVFITPMAAVAGSVADHLLQTALEVAPKVQKLWINNGGDIAIHLAHNQSLTLGLVDDPLRPAINGKVIVDAAARLGGVATSGWRGRSHSLGIADAVTVLAVNAAAADAAATLIANAVNIDHPAVIRKPAQTLKDDTDLGAQLVTVNVGRLDALSITTALQRGRAVADALRTFGAISAAALRLQGRWCIVGDGFKPPPPPPISDVHALRAAALMSA